MAIMAIHRRSLLSIALLFITAAIALVHANGEPTRLLRSPTISATQIAFAYANNIWVVERGGERRLPPRE
jgi:tricorn protease